MTDTSASWSPFRPFPDCSAECAERECVSRGLHFCSFFSNSFTLLRVCFSIATSLSLVLLSASLLETFALDYLQSLHTLLILLLEDRLLYFRYCCCCCCTKYKFPLPICFSLPVFSGVFLQFRSSVSCNKPVFKAEAFSGVCGICCGI